MSRTKKRLKIKTVIHRARKYVQEGNKTEAINTIVRDAHYTVAEAEKLAEYIGYFSEVEFDRNIVDTWCDEHRMSGFLCRDQHPQEQEDDGFPPPAAVPSPTPVRRANCICGQPACDDEWHRLAMWIGDNPQGWSRLVEELGRHFGTA
jgi:hypothetical protein